MISRSVGLLSLLGIIGGGLLHCGSDGASALDVSVDAGVDVDPVDGADASPDPLVPRGTVIDFRSTSAAFPPTVNKVGFNSFWNAARNDGDFDAWTMRRSAKFRAPMIGALIEPKSLVVAPGFKDGYEEYASDFTAAQLDMESCALWQPGFTETLFSRNTTTGVVEARVPTDPDLAYLRTTAQASGLINLLQLSGTPGTVPSTSTLDNGLFTLVGTPTTGGNWYPLPANNALPELARAFGTFPDAVGYDTRTIYAFWQEPSHTISESLTAANSIDKYTSFYWQVASEIATRCRFQSCPMAGAQLNANDGDHTPNDGYRYKWFMDALRGHRAANPGVDIPLDYFTIQNYSAQWNADIIRNSRVALGTDSSWTPVMMNEWDYCVNSRAGDGCTADLNRFEERYDGATAWNALHWLEDTLERPDLSHVLLREKVLKDRDGKTGAYSHPWTQVPILFRASMSELRRPISVETPDLPIIASGDDDQLTILGWNEGATSKSLTLSLTNIPGKLLGKTLFVKRISKKIRDARCPGSADVMDANHDITCWEDAVAPRPITRADVAIVEVAVAEGEATMIFAGSPPAYSSSLFTTSFVRSFQHVRRDGGTAAPDGMAHFDPRTGSITVGVRRDGVGLGRMLLRNAPSTVVVSTRFAAQGALPAATAAAGIRVDYLDASRVPVKTVFFRDERWPTGPVRWGSLDWPTATVVKNVSTNLCGAGCTEGSGADVTLDLAGNAPPEWSGTKEVDVGVVLVGAATDATYRVDFP